MLENLDFSFSVLNKLKLFSTNIISGIGSWVTSVAPPSIYHKDTVAYSFQKLSLLLPLLLDNIYIVNNHILHAWGSIWARFLIINSVTALLLYSIKGKLTFSNTTVFRYYYSNSGKHKATLTFTISKFG